jgi:hypothetical protein
MVSQIKISLAFVDHKRQVNVMFNWIFKRLSIGFIDNINVMGFLEKKTLKN